MYAVAILKGLATYIPGIMALRRGHTGGSDSARYCYAVWLQHLARAAQSGLCAGTPRVVAELGPGDSVGAGIAALLSGAEAYVGLDVVEYAASDRNLAILDELVELFRSRAPIPGADEFPRLRPRCADPAFPADLIAPGSLEPERVERIRAALKAPTPGGMFRYVAPWDSDAVVAAESVDMVFSQAVLEHVSDLPHTYDAMRRWLRPGGFMSHVIDFQSHYVVPEWYGHWSFGDGIWKIVMGKRPYLINREPLSTHRRLLEQYGYRVALLERYDGPAPAPRQALAARFRALDDEDLITCGAFVQALPTAAGG